MPAKAKKGSKKEDGGEDAASLSAEERAAYYKSSATSLQLQLSKRTELMNEAKEEKQSLEERVQKMSLDFDVEQKTAFEITRDMTRQYKSMQEQLVDRITELSRTVQDLQDRLEEAEQHHTAIITEKDKAIDLKDKEIEEIKQKMEDMAQEFGGMLKETLDKMRQRIEINSSTVDMDTDNNTWGQDLPNLPALMTTSDTK